LRIVEEPGPEVSGIAKWPLGLLTARFGLAGNVTGALKDRDLRHFAFWHQWLGRRLEFILEIAVLQEGEEVCVNGIGF
jgi:hypothetical protein